MTHHKNSNTTQAILLSKHVSLSQFFYTTYINTGNVCPTMMMMMGDFVDTHMLTRTASTGNYNHTSHSSLKLIHYYMAKRRPQSENSNNTHWIFRQLQTIAITTVENDTEKSSKDAPEPSHTKCIPTTPQPQDAT